MPSLDIEDERKREWERESGPRPPNLLDITICFALSVAFRQLSSLLLCSLLPLVRCGHNANKRALQKEGVFLHVKRGRKRIGWYCWCFYYIYVWWREIIKVIVDLFRVVAFWKQSYKGDEVWRGSFWMNFEVSTWLVTTLGICTWRGMLLVATNRWGRLTSDLTTGINARLFIIRVEVFWNVGTNCKYLL